MTHYPRIGSCTRLVLLFLALINLTFSATIYVKPGGAGGGSSWADAYGDLQDALDVAVSGDEIWVAAGTYYPSVEVGGTGSAYQTFQMINGVAIYGGFAGDEESGTFDLTDRDFVANETILSGDIGVADDPNDNCYHVFFHDGINLDATAVLDGFTVTAGNADDLDVPHDSGAGMYNYLSSPTVSNCTFSDNTAYVGGGMMNEESSNPTVTDCTFIDNAAYAGGGMYNLYTSSPSVTDCVFSVNVATDYGGGMANEGDVDDPNLACNPTVTGCTFTSNATDQENGTGGAMDNYASSPTVTDCTFNGNLAYDGGGMSNYDYCDTTLINCAFSGNTADNWGGGMLNENSNPTVANCTFSGNTADFSGGMDNYLSDPTIINSIFWGNIGISDDDEIYNDESTPVITNCDIAGSGGSGVWDTFFGTDGGGNLDVDPNFVDPNGLDNTPGTEDDNLQLQDGSPCINAGENSAVPVGVTTDLNGGSRIADGTVDMGAYEFGSTLTVTSPISGDRWAKGQTYDITWSTDNPSPNVKILLFKGNSKVLTIKNPTLNDDIHPWKIPTSLSKGANYRIKIICIDDTAVFGFSDVFEIVGACDLFTPIEVTDPGSTTDWQMGQSPSIEWTGGEPDQNVKILLYKGSDKKRTITVSTPNDGEYDYTIPYDLPPGSNYKIQVKVLDSSCSSLVDKSDFFTISIPPVEVSVPDDSTEWMMGDTDVEINWSGFPPGDVNIKLFKGSDAVKTISDGTLNNGSYTWATVPYSLKPGSNYRVRVTSKVNKKINTFSDYFSIQIPPINVVDPNSSTEWKRGHTHEIQWTGGKPSKTVKINLLKAGVKVKTIKSETKNDGLYHWTVPTGLALESDYSVEVIYKPDTSMRDTSDTFAVINSPVGTWVGVWDDAPDSGPLKLAIKNNDTVEGTFKLNGIKFPFSGTYSYDYATGEFLSSLSGIKKIDGRPKYRIALVTAGTCVNNEMTGTYSGTIEKKKDGEFGPYEDLDGTFTVNR